MIGKYYVAFFFFTNFAAEKRTPGLLLKTRSLDNAIQKISLA